MLLSVILASGTLMLLPYMIGWLVDEVISSQNMSRFIYIVGIYGAVYVFNQAMYTIVNIMEKVTSTAFLFDIRSELYSRILRFKGCCLAGMYSGDTVHRMEKDVGYCSGIYVLFQCMDGCFYNRCDSGHRICIKIFQ